mmetsp:Transcript_52394/g.132440  ORF Transcript_52394/g.132440 Transcript_52394/m.132440 type:complete len:202 (+) Transcript_52394:98-703(+)
MHVPLVVGKHVLQPVHVGDRQGSDDEHDAQHPSDTHLELFVSVITDAPNVVEVLECSMGMAKLKVVARPRDLVHLDKSLNVLGHNDHIDQLIQFGNERQGNRVQHEVLKASGRRQPPGAEPPQVHRNQDLGDEDEGNDENLCLARCGRCQEVLFGELDLGRVVAVGLLQVAPQTQIAEGFTQVDPACRCPNCEDRQKEHWL